MVVAASVLKEEIYVVNDIEDLEDAITCTMGRDMWDTIMCLVAEKIEENQEESKYTEYDIDLSALRRCVSDEIQELDKLVSYVNDSTRLNRAVIIEEICGIKRRLTENEGYY